MEKSWAGIGVKTAHRPGDPRSLELFGQNRLKSKESPFEYLKQKIKALVEQKHGFN